MMACIVDKKKPTTTILSTSNKMSYQRNLANMRERKRMMLINKGFDLLKSKLPIQDLMCCKVEKKNSNACERILLKQNCYDSDDLIFDETCKIKNHVKKHRLTKLDILRLTIDYIKQLKEFLLTTTNFNNNFQEILNDRKAMNLNVIQKVEKTTLHDKKVAKVNQGSKDIIKRKRIRKPMVKHNLKLDKQATEAKYQNSLLASPKSSLVVCWNTKKYHLSVSKRSLCFSENCKLSKLWIPASH